MSIFFDRVEVIIFKINDKVSKYIAWESLKVPLLYLYSRCCFDGPTLCRVLNKKSLINRNGNVRSSLLSRAPS